MSEPSSIVPVVSIVTWAITGMRRDAYAGSVNTSKIAEIAHLVCSRSWQVSTSSTSEPPSMSPRACSM